MERETFVIVGLGNPDDRYAHTRHNAGFDATDVLARRLGVQLTRSRCKGLVGETVLGSRRVILCHPQTYMNLSGECVAELLRWYKIPLDHLLVIYDDIDLPMGRLRMRAAGSAGTHNGMRSILSCVPGPQFPRIRVGVGAKPEGWDLVDWVLSRYGSPEDRAVMEEAFARAADCAQEWVERGTERAMQLCNRNPQPEKKA